MGNRIITISREFGSGGRTIGKRVSEKLGIPCCDAELIQKIAEESGFATDYIKEEDEYVAGGRLAPVLSRRIPDPPPFHAQIAKRAHPKQFPGLNALFSPFFPLNYAINLMTLHQRRDACSLF